MTPFTTFSADTPDVKRFFQASRSRVSPFSEKFHPSVKIWSALRLIYQSFNGGKLGEGSDKSAPMIEKSAQSWDRPTNWPADELVPRVHGTLELEIQERGKASHV
ncbi:MAG: hypothetical protein JOZ18_14990 [Chloroflexi bacterium]|nr:hypothetical protein [Chloroflexota bacterium]